MAENNGKAQEIADEFIIIMTRLNQRDIIEIIKELEKESRLLR